MPIKLSLSALAAMTTLLLAVSVNAQTIAPNAREYVAFEHQCNISALGISVYGDDLQINVVSPRFRNGDEKTVHLNQYFYRGQNVFWIPFQRGERCVTGVYLNAGTDNDGRQATVVFWGRQHGRAIELGQVDIQEYRRWRSDCHSRGWGQGHCGDGFHNRGRPGNGGFGHGNGVGHPRRGN